MSTLKKASVNASSANKIAHINLLEACTVITIKDFSVYSVTTNQTNHSSKSRMKSTPAAEVSSSDKFSSNFYLNTYCEKFLESNFSEFNIPTDTVLINIFLSEFYFPDEFNYPLPNIQIYAQISPLKLNVDYLTLLWINMILLALSTEIIPLVNSSKPTVTNTTTSQLFDACIECILPKLSLKLYNSKAYDSKIPKYLNILCSCLKLTNLCNEQQVDLKNLCKKAFKNENLSQNLDKWPFEPTDLLMIPTCLLDICKEMQATTNERVDERLVSPKHGLLVSKLSKKEFKTNKISSPDLFLLSIDKLWIEMSLNYATNSNPENLVIPPTSFKIWLLNTNGYYSKIRNDGNPSQLRFGEILSESSRSFFIDDLSLLNNQRKCRINNNNNNKRSKSCDSTSSGVKKRANVGSRKHYNTKLNAICDIESANVKISHYQLLFLLRLLDEISFFQSQLEQDAFKVVTSLNKDFKRLKSNESSLESVLSLSIAVFIDKLEAKLVINDKRKFVKVAKAVEKEEYTVTAVKIENDLIFVKNSPSQDKVPIAVDEPMQLVEEDEFVVIPDFKKPIKIMTKIDKDINYLILKEHIQQIYGVLDNSKYLRNNTSLPSLASPSHTQSLQTISSQMNPISKATVGAHKTLSRVSQVLELNVASLKSADKKSTLRSFSFRSAQNDSDSVLDAYMDEDSDSESISVSAIGMLNIDNSKALPTNDTENHISSSLPKESPSIAASNEILSTSPDVEATCFEVPVKLSSLQFCLQLIKDEMCVLGRLYSIDICDNNEFTERNENGEINIRFSRGSNSSHKQYGANYSGFVELRISKECFNLNQSTLVGLLEMLEDEPAEKSLPVKIIIDNCKINMSVSMRIW